VPFTKLIAILLLTVLAAGCGHKGPLYLPGQKPAPAKPATTP
jgi:predicted small lipoprotein YifL